MNDSTNFMQYKHAKSPIATEFTDSQMLQSRSASSCGMHPTAHELVHLPEAIYLDTPNSADYGTLFELIGFAMKKTRRNREFGAVKL